MESAYNGAHSDPTRHLMPQSKTSTRNGLQFLELFSKGNPYNTPLNIRADYGYLP